MTACDAATWLGWALMALGALLGVIGQLPHLRSRWHERRARRLERRGSPAGADITAIDQHRGNAAYHREAARAHAGPLRVPPTWAMALILAGVALRPLAAVLGAECI